MKVFVVGSCRHLDPNSQAHFISCCEALGRAYTAVGVKFVLCSLSPHTADPYFARGVTFAKKTKWITYFVPIGAEPKPSTAHTVVWCEGGWRVCHLRAIRGADVVLAIGGSTTGTTPVIYAADAEEKPVILLPGFRGAAEQNLAYFGGRYYLDSEVNFLRSDIPKDPSNWADDVVRLTDSVYLRHRKAAMSRGLFPVVGMALIGMIGWMWTFFADISWMPPEFRLCMALGCTAIAGSMFRALLRKVGALDSEWAGEDLVSASTIGLLMGFGTLILAELGSHSFGAVALKLDTRADLQRVIATLSPVVLAGAIFLEAAWRQFKNKAQASLEAPKRSNTIN